MNHIHESHQINSWLTTIEALPDKVMDNNCSDPHYGKIVWAGASRAHLKTTDSELYYFQSSDTAINIKTLVVGDRVKFCDFDTAYKWSPKNLKVALDVRLDSE